jgi:hypothetical protein
VLGQTIGIRNVRDGTSKTIGFGEWGIGDGNSNMVTLPTDIVFVGFTPSGTARNNGTLIMPNPPRQSGRLELARWLSSETNPSQGSQKSTTSHVLDALLVSRAGSSGSRQASSAAGKKREPAHKRAIR